MLSIVAGFGVWGCQCFHLPRGQRPRRFSAPTLFARATVEEECSTDKTPMTLVMNLLLVTTTMLVDEDEHGDCVGGDGGNHDNNKFTFVMKAANMSPANTTMRAATCSYSDTFMQEKKDANFTCTLRSPSQ